MPHKSDRPADRDPAHIACDFMGRSVTPPGMDISSVFTHTLECIGMCASSSLPVPEFLAWTTGSIAAALGVPLVKYLEPRGADRSLIVRAGTGWPPGIVGDASVLNKTTSLAGLTFHLGVPCVCGDLAHAVDLTDASLLRRHDVVSSACVCVSSADAPLGVLSVHSLLHREFTAMDVNFLAHVASVIGARLRLRRTGAGRRSGVSKAGMWYVTPAGSVSSPNRSIR